MINWSGKVREFFSRNKVATMYLVAADFKINFFSKYFDVEPLPRILINLTQVIDAKCKSNIHVFFTFCLKSIRKHDDQILDSSSRANGKILFVKNSPTVPKLRI